PLGSRVPNGSFSSLLGGTPRHFHLGAASEVKQAGPRGPRAYFFFFFAPFFLAAFLAFFLATNSSSVKSSGKHHGDHNRFFESCACQNNTSTSLPVSSAA